MTLKADEIFAELNPVIIKLSCVSSTFRSDRTIRLNYLHWSELMPSDHPTP